MSQLSHNLELKAVLADLGKARDLIIPLGVTSVGMEKQTDTFFPVPCGRLKLREIEGKQAVLIWYDRPDGVEARVSKYLLAPIHEPALVKTALASGLGVRGEVRKVREIFLWHNVRIHLDEVSGLGAFIEFEAVLSPEDDERTAHDRLDHLCQLLNIRRKDHLATSYADLLRL